MIDFIHKCGGERSGISRLQIVGWVGIARSKFYDWRDRYGKANEHNAWIPRDHWIEGWERDRIVEFARAHPLEGYRRLTLMPPPPGSGTLWAACGSPSRGFPAPRLMMLDRDVVAVSPSTTYRVLSAEGLLQKWIGRPSRKGTGFEQPLSAHEHWHVDVSHINVAGTLPRSARPSGSLRLAVSLRSALLPLLAARRLLPRHRPSRAARVHDRGRRGTGTKWR